MYYIIGYFLGWIGCVFFNVPRWYMAQTNTTDIRHATFMVMLLSTLFGVPITIVLIMFALLSERIRGIYGKKES